MADPTKTVTNPRIAKLLQYEDKLDATDRAELEGYRRQGLAPKADSVSATEGERKASAFLSRALGSNTSFEGAGQGPRGLPGQSFKDNFPNAANYFASDGRQVADSAQDEFIAATLRQDSGAAIPPEELERQRRIYFPMPGDGEAVIAQKRQARLRALDGLYQSAGRGLTPEQKEQFSKYRTDIDAALKGEMAPAANGDGGKERLSLLDAPAATLDVATGVRGGPLEVEIPNIAGGQTPEFRAGLKALLDDPNTTRDQIFEYWDKNAPGALEKGADPRPAPLATERGKDDTITGAAIENVDAAVRGAADTLTLGLATRGAALADTVSNGGTYAENLARQRGVDEYDAQVNPWMRGAGQLAGAFGIPSRALATRDLAESSAIAKGMGVSEARLAARKAFAARLGAESAAAGGAYGFNSEYGDWEEKAGAGLRNAVIGGALGYGLGRAFGVEPPDIPDSPAGAPTPPIDGSLGGAARRLRITPTPATVGGPTAAGAQRVLGNLPGSAGPIREAVEKETEDLANAARAVSDKMGPRGTPQSAGEGVAKGADQWLSGEKATGSNLYRLRDEMIGGPDTPVVMGSTGKLLAQFKSDFPSSQVLGQMMDHPAVRKIGEAMSDAGGELTLDEATEALSHIRGVVRNAEASKAITGPMRARIAKLEQAIENDVTNAAKASDAIQGRSGPFTAENAQRQADTHWSAMKDAEGGEMKRLLASAGDDIKTSGESVFRQIFNDMNRDGGNLQRLRGAWGRLPKEARDSFSATAFDQLGRARNSAQDAAGDAWSFETFMTNWSAKSPEAKKLVFSGRGVDREIDDIVRYADRLRQLDKSRNFSNTSPNQLAGGTAIAAMTALMTGNFGTAASIAGTYAGLNGLARTFLGVPAMRQWMRSALHATVKGATGNSGAEANLRVLIRRLPSLAARNPKVADEIGQLEKALLGAANDNAGLTGVASDQQQQTEGGNR